MLESRAVSRYELGQAEETEKPAFSELFNFGRSYLYVVALCVTFYSAVFPFRTFAIKFYQEYHDMSREAAGQLNSGLIFAAMVFTPLFGLLVDRVGKRALFMMFGSLLMVPVYRLVFEPLRAYLIYTSAAMALRGVGALWNKLPRSGSLDARHTSKLVSNLSELPQQFGKITLKSVIFYYFERIVFKCKH